MKIAIAQINTTVGDFEGNFNKMSSFLDRAKEADLVVFPECAICGYPQQDLMDYSSFARRSEATANRLIEKHSNQSFIFGSIESNRRKGKPYRNVAIFASQGKVLGTYFKQLLPTYDVFDEDRFFEPGEDTCLVSFLDEKIGLSICEDIWSDEIGTPLRNRYGTSPLDGYSEATLFVNLSASPFEYEKVQAKREMLKKIAIRHQKPLIYVNSVGANDSLIFDGRSYVWNQKGEVLLSAKAFQEDLLVMDTQLQRHPPVEIKDDPMDNIHDALVLGIKDYCRKQNFSQVVLGLSGGIDSCVIACFAVKALGAENVFGVLLPSQYTSDQSNDDALALAKALGIKTETISIEAICKTTQRSLQNSFRGTEPGVAEENIQARARGILLMALSNKFGYLVLTTGNKSELAVGYCTLYGDMCGGLAPLSDVYKMQVYALGRKLNQDKVYIPESVFSKAPTAELRPNQTDQDQLPPYALLDEILKDVIERFSSFEELEAKYDKKTLDEVRRFLRTSEYKRYQMPLGLKVSPKAFGVGRRMPLVHKFF